MPPEDRERRRLGIYLTISQVGMEMVVPGVVGLWLDNTFNWLPWATITGVVLGFVLGITHLTVLMKKSDEDEPPKGTKS